MTDQIFPHADTVRAAAAFPADTDRRLNEILHQRNEADARLIASIVAMYMRSPEGRKVLLGALDKDLMREIALEVYRSMPVRPHTHRAQSVKLSTRVRGLSRIGAIIGALIGGLLAWRLVTLYAITTISFGNSVEMHSVSVTWIKVAISAIVVLFCAGLGSLIGGPRKEQEQIANVDINLEMAAQPMAAPAVVGNTDGGAGR